jgi:hypothetical protein
VLQLTSLYLCRFFVCLVCVDNQRNPHHENNQSTASYTNNALQVEQLLRGLLLLDTSLHEQRVGVSWSNGRILPCIFSVELWLGSNRVHRTWNIVSCDKLNTSSINVPATRVQKKPCEAAHAVPLRERAGWDR